MKIVKVNSFERREENKEPLGTGYRQNYEVTAIVQENLSLGKVCSPNKENISILQKNDHLI